ncbi:hypothetical protein LP420_03850 [Massilia sp. B-10]|nr:hypothetical protein LP420_03850 [Massilia sp. B-10]
MQHWRLALPPQPAAPPSRPRHAAALTSEQVNQAARDGTAGASPAAVLRAQVLLDRAHFSPGEIDGATGSNLRRALARLPAQAGPA